MTAPETAPLVAEVMKKASVVWIAVGDTRPAPAWTVWIDGAACLVAGGREQPLPSLAEATACSVTARSGSSRARIVTWEASVERLTPGSDDWRATASALVTKRLNLSVSDDTLGRWAAECGVYRLTPSGAAVLGDALPDDRQDGPPPATPAATRTTIPYTLGTHLLRGRRKTRRQG